MTTPRPPTNSFRDGLVEGVVVRPLRAHHDERGWLIELFRHDELPPENHPVMAYVSETLPGVARGPHEHREQSDCFAFVGPGDFKLYFWDQRPDSPTVGRRQVTLAGASHPTAVIVPPGVVHAYKNVSTVPGWVFNAPNALYAGEGRREAVDEIRHEHRADSTYLLD